MLAACCVSDPRCWCHCPEIFASGFQFPVLLYVGEICWKHAHAEAGMKGESLSVSKVKWKGNISYLLSVQHRHNTLCSDHRSFVTSFSADDVVVFVLI